MIVLPCAALPSLENLPIKEDKMEVYRQRSCKTTMGDTGESRL